MRIIFLFCLLFTPIVFAENCPKAIDVQQHNIKGWHIYDSDTDELVSSARAKKFTAMAKQFALAEWVTTGKKKGSIHCYYRDEDGSNFESYLAKDSMVIGSKDNSWYRVTGSMQCAADVASCNFNNVKPIQLARK